MVKHASILVSIVLACFYVIGLVSYRSFLGEFGLNDTQFPLTVDRVFFHGFLSLSFMTLKSAIYLALAAACVMLIAGLVSLVFSIAEKKKIDLNFLRLLKNNNADKRGSLYRFSKNIFLYFSIALVAYSLMLFSITITSAAGVDLADSFIANTAKDDYKKQAIKLKGNDETLGGYVIVCSLSQCAYYVGDGSLVVNNADVEWVKSF